MANTTSYDRFSYQIRPRKATQRRMILDALQHLGGISQLKDYRYIGFGSVYFVDFLLFHRYTGIEDMVSIEGNTRDRKRFEFCTPLSSIDVKFGMSHEVLPEIEWNKPTVAWLDYDTPLDANKIADLQTFANNALTNSMLILTLDANSGKTVDEHRQYFEKIREDIGESRFTATEQIEDWTPTRTPTSIRKIVTDALQSAISDRNRLLGEDEKLAASQIMYFVYADGAQMTSLAWILHRAADQASIKRAFDRCNVLRWEDQYFEVHFPLLTRPELQIVDQLSAAKLATAIKKHRIPKKHVDEYLKVYRFMPRYTEQEW